jgi:hypothetical protein
VIVLVLVVAASTVEPRSNAERYRRWVHALSPSTITRDHLDDVLDEDVTVVKHAGHISEDDTIEGLDNVVKAFQKWFPAGSDADLAVEAYFENEVGEVVLFLLFLKSIEGWHPGVRKA